jgi:hypothetical protein
MRHKRCTDPRDKFFGIWGMVDYLSHLEDFKIDYSMTVTQVYEELARVSFMQFDVSPLSWPLQFSSLACSK